MRDEAAEKRWEMRSLSELFDEKIEREAEKFMKELIGDCEWCDLNKDSFIRGANSIKGMILDLVEALEDSRETLDAVISVEHNWSLEQERLGNKAICLTAIAESDKALQKLRKELGDEKT